MNKEQFTQKYFDLLTNEYAGINLTRITSFDEFRTKQIEDSQVPFTQYEQMKNALLKSQRLIDVGFGGGFPLLPLAFEFPMIQFVGIETRNKKVKVVGEIAAHLGLKNINLVHQRIENIYIDIPYILSMKAVGKIQDFHPRISSEIETKAFYYKGPSFEQDEQPYISKMDYRVHNINLDESISRKVIEVSIKPKEYRSNLVKLSTLL